MQLYFLCTGNSSRSQLAESYARYYAPEDWIIKSAGTNPHGVHPKTIEVLEADGIPTASLTSDPIDLDYLNTSDFVITLCGDANDRCPITPPHVQRIHFPLEDPAAAIGSAESITAVFEDMRQTIKLLMFELVADIKAQ